MPLQIVVCFFFGRCPYTVLLLASCRSPTITSLWFRSQISSTLNYHTPQANEEFKVSKDIYIVSIPILKHILIELCKVFFFNCKFQSIWLKCQLLSSTHYPLLSLQIQQTRWLPSSHYMQKQQKVLPPASNPNLQHTSLCLSIPNSHQFIDGQQLTGFFFFISTILLTVDQTRWAELWDLRLHKLATKPEAYVSSKKPIRLLYFIFTGHFKSTGYFTQRHGQNGACSMVETAWQGEKRGTWQLSVSVDQSAFTRHQDKEVRKRRGNTNTKWAKWWQQAVNYSANNHQGADFYT